MTMHRMTSHFELGLGIAPTLTTSAFDLPNDRKEANMSGLLRDVFVAWRYEQCNAGSVPVTDTAALITASKSGRLRRRCGP